MRLVVASLTGALLYVSVKSLSIGPLPCTTPEVSAPQYPSTYFFTFFRACFSIFYLFAPITNSLFAL